MRMPMIRHRVAMCGTYDVSVDHVPNLNLLWGLYHIMCVFVLVYPIFCTYPREDHISHEKLQPWIYHCLDKLVWETMRLWFILDIVWGISLRGYLLGILRNCLFMWPKHWCMGISGKVNGFPPSSFPLSLLFPPLLSRVMSTCACCPFWLSTALIVFLMILLLSTLLLCFLACLREWLLHDFDTYLDILGFSPFCIIS